ncbi:MAG: hypothetical protein WD027_06375 [Gaiellales bacterium]
MKFIRARLRTQHRATQRDSDGTASVSPSPPILGLAATLAGAGFLLARLVGDVEEKPLFEDEAVSGLISARPFGEVIVTTLWDRGGAPLHFVLAHIAFLVDTSPETLRALSVVFAVAALPLCFDLARRLGGPVAGGAAALVAAGSGMLAVYGSFGRMYALFAFAGALAGDLFVRALQRPTAGTAAAAAAGAWLLPAVHPYGGIVVALEVLVVLALWRGRPIRPALPAAAIAIAMIPFAVADVRLATRFEVGSEEGGRLATPGEAWEQIEAAVRGFAGGEGLILAVFLGLALAGAIILARREPAFVAFAALALVTPPLLALLVRTENAPDLSPRHLIYALPFWAAFIGVAVARLPAKPIALAGVGLLAAFGTQGINDPRDITYIAPLGTKQHLAAPADWLRDEIEEDDVLYPYSSVFLAALPEAGKAFGLPRAQPQSLIEAAERVDFPTRAIFVAVPTGTARINGPVPGEDFGSWLLVEVEGPFPDAAALLRAASGVLAEVRPSLTNVPELLADWFELNREVLCDALSRLGSECETTV